MTERAQAVPLARKKRRRPPSKALIWTAFNLGWCITWLLFDLIIILLGDHSAVILVCTGIVAAGLVYWWPIFRREYKAWKDSE